MVQTRKSKVGSRPPHEVEEEQNPSISESPRRRSHSPDKQRATSSLQGSGFDPSQPLLFEEDQQQPQIVESTARRPMEVLKTREVVPIQPRRRPRGTLRSFLATLGMLYLGATYFLSCHNTRDSDNPVCKAFYAADEARTQALDYVHTYAKPHLDRANAYVEPYAAQVRPHYDRATNLAKPYALSAQKAYDQHVHPQFVNAGRQASAAASPYLDKAQQYHSKTIQPQIRQYQQIGKKLHADHIQPNLQKGQAAVRPHLDYAQKVLAPAAQRYYDDVAVPYASRTYSVSRDTYVHQVHPRLTSSWSAFLAFIRARVLPMFSRMNAVYVQPQFDRVREKVFEARTKKAAAEAIVEVEAKEKEIAHEEGIEELDAFIEELRAEVLEAEEPAPQVPPSSTITASRTPTTVDAAAQAKLKELVSEKRKKLEAESDRYEAEIEQLAKTERVLLVQRLNSIRAAAARDIPARFDTRVNDVRHETSKMLAKLEKYFDRASQEEGGDVDEKVADAETIASKAVVKLANRAEEVQDELDQYTRTHQDKEAKAVQQSYEAVRTLVGTAQEVLGNGWTWLHDVSVDDWSRYHQLQKREDRIHGEYRDLATGKSSDPQLDSANSPAKLLVQYKDDVDELVDTFESRLHKAKKAGIKRLRGSVGDSVRAAYESAKSAVGIDRPEPTPSDVSGSASSLYSVASESAASAYEAVSKAAESAVPDYAQISASASSVASMGSSYASSAYSIVAENVPGSDELTSSLHEATRSVIRAVGATPSPPEGVAEHAESLLARASQAVVGDPAASGFSASASSLASVVAESAASAGTAASSYASSYASQLSETVSSNLPEASDLSSSLHQATRIVVRAAGGDVTPEGVQEHAASLYAKASGAVAGSPEPAASSVSSGASSLAQRASSYASSIASIASRSASSFASAASVRGSSVASAASASGPASLSSVASVASSSGSSAASALGESARSVLSAASGAVSGTPAASGLSASASSVVSAGVDGASSVLHDATRAAIRGVGGEPSPERPAEYFESATRAVSRQVIQATQSVDEAVESLKSAAERVRARLEL